MRRALVVGLVMAGTAVVHAAAPSLNDLPNIETRLALVLREGATPSATTQTLHPGDIIGLQLEWPAGLRPENPALSPPEDQAAPGKVLPRRLVPRDPRAGGRDTIEILVASLGKTEVPALLILDGSGKPVARTKPLNLDIAAALKESESDPAPARPPIRIPPELAGILAAAALVFAVAGGVGFLAYRVWKRRHFRVPGVPPGMPREPADIRALRDLDALLAEGLVERGEIKPFCVRLAEIGKGFLGELTDLPLLERTTRECVRALARCRLPRERTRWFGPWLNHLDLVKFAKHRPGAADLAQLSAELRAAILEAAREREAPPPLPPSTGPLPAASAEEQP